MGAASGLGLVDLDVLLDGVDQALAHVVGGDGLVRNLTQGDHGVLVVFGVDRDVRSRWRWLWLCALPKGPARTGSELCRRSLRRSRAPCDDPSSLNANGIGPGTDGPQPCLIWSGFSHEVGTKSRAWDDLMSAAFQPKRPSRVRALAPSTGWRQRGRELGQGTSTKARRCASGWGRTSRARPRVAPGPALAPAAIVQDVDVEWARR